MSWSVSLSFALSVILMAGPGGASADVVTDGSVGPGLTLQGADKVVGADLGRIEGSNLFHSFSRFEIDAGESVTFTGPDGLRHVVGRVTGGRVSTIDGLLRSRVGRADLWLLNPAGIAFGPNARLDLPASLHLSTAQQLVFGDGSTLDTGTANAAVLTVAAPDAFGFLGGTPAAISMNGSRLQFAKGAGLTLAGGDLALDLGGVVRAPAGSVRLASVAAPARVDAATGAVTGERGGGALVSLDRGFRLDVGGDGGGLVRVTGDDVAMTGGARISADNDGAGDAPGRGIALDLSGGLRIVGSRIEARRLASGDGGDVRIDARTVDLVDNGIVTVESTGGRDAAGMASGRAGSITVRARDIGLVNTNENLPADRATGFVARTTNGGGGGSIDLAASGRLLLQDGLVSASTFGSGDAGSITIDAGRFEMRSLLPQFATAVSVRSNLVPASADRPAFEVADAGSAGSIAISVDGPMVMENGVAIGSATATAGDAGSVRIDAGSLTMQGPADLAGLDRTAAEAALPLISAAADTGSRGNAGTVDVTVADRAQLLGGAQIRSSTDGAGTAGAVSVDAGSLEIDGFFEAFRNGSDPAFFSAVTAISGPNAVPPAGDVVVTVRDRLTLSSGGRITSSTASAADAGRVTVRAGEASITGIGSDLFTGIFALTQPASSGNAGTIDVAVDRGLTITDGGRISSLSRGSGRAGSVTVAADRIVLATAPGATATFTGIQASGLSRAAGSGSVAVETRGLLRIDDALISSSTFSGRETADAGGVSVTAGALRITDGTVLPVSGIISQAGEGSAGDAGDVAVAVRRSASITGRRSVVTARTAVSSGGDAGRVNVALLGGGTLALSDAAKIGSEARGAGRAGAVRVDTGSGRLAMSGGSEIDSASVAPGQPAGTIDVTGRTLFIERSSVTTEGAQAPGGQITIGEAGTTRVIVLTDADVTSNGLQFDFGSSLISLNGDFIAIRDGSSIQSCVPDCDTVLLADEVRPVAATAARASVQGRIATLVSDDSTVQATTAVAFSGLDSEIGSDLQVPEGSLLDTGKLLAESCAAGRPSGSSSFVQTGRGGLRASPVDPLAAHGLDGERAESGPPPVTTASHAADSGPLRLAALRPCAKPQTVAIR